MLGVPWRPRTGPREPASERRWTPLAYVLAARRHLRPRIPQPPGRPQTTRGCSIPPGPSSAVAAQARVASSAAAVPRRSSAGPVVAGVVGVAVEPPAQVLEPGELTTATGSNPGRGRPPGPRAARSHRGRTPRRRGPRPRRDRRDRPANRADGGLGRPSRPACTRRTAVASGRPESDPDPPAALTRRRRGRAPIRRSMTALSSIDEPRIPPVRVGRSGPAPRHVAGRSPASARDRRGSRCPGRAR